MKIDKKILICYNAPASIFPVYNGKPLDVNLPSKDLSETEYFENKESIRNQLQKYFSTVEILAVDRNVERVINKINKFSPDAIFNFVEAIEGISSFEYCAAGLFELLGFDYTGNTPFCLGNSLNKERTKNILRSFKIRTPKSQTLSHLPKSGKSNGRQLKKLDLKFPVILKLLNEDASIGISEFSVVNNSEELKKQYEFLSETYKQDIIAEEYIDGRELNVAILGDTVLPVSEIDFTGLPDKFPKIVTYDGKWIAESIYYENTKPKCPADLDKKLKRKVTTIALEAFSALSCRDYARVDLRVDKSGKSYVIEVNPNPDISEDSGFARAAVAKGITYPELLYTIANFAINRKNNDSQNKAV